MSGKTKLFLILPLLIFIFGFTPSLNGQIVNPITVTTDKSLYYEGETIVISGEVSEILYGYAVSLLITGPNGDAILIDQLIVDQNKKFQTELTAGGQLMNKIGSGMYTVSVLYATENRTAETTFQYISSNPEQDVSDFGALGSEHSHAGILVKIFGDEFDFSQPAYQIKSSFIHFESNDGTTIHKHATGVTLGYLFDTLRLGLDDQCFVFKDGKSFCTNENYSLKIFINGESVNDIKDYEILEGDQILIFYDVVRESYVPLDVTSPKILQPHDIVVYAETHDGITRVTFDVLVIDDTDKIIQPTCKPSSGYFFGIGDTIVKCTAKDSAGNFATPVSFTVTINPPETTIPSWVKNVAGFWCQDKINDASFVEAIQYLIDNGIIVVPATQDSFGGTQEIPQWVKNNACWWSDGSITDLDFALGLEYLVKQGIIRV